jgi:hypothetical protein
MTQPFPGSRDGSRLSPFGHGLSFIFGEPEANLVTKTHTARQENMENPAILDDLPPLNQ